jgi:hypothetical protein
MPASQPAIRENETKVQPSSIPDACSLTLRSISRLGQDIPSTCCPSHIPFDDCEIPIESNHRQSATPAVVVSANDCFVLFCFALLCLVLPRCSDKLAATTAAPSASCQLTSLHLVLLSPHLTLPGTNLTHRLWVRYLLLFCLISLTRPENW